MTAATVRTGIGAPVVATGAIVFFAIFIWRFHAGGDGFGADTLDSTGMVGGAWLTEVVLRLVGLLALPWPTSVVLAVFSACIAGLILAWLYRGLVYNEWHPAEALLFVFCFAGNALVIEAIAVDHRAIPLMLACAALIPGIRRLESVGDVQAEMSYGLVLPLLFLAGPETVPLIPVLALLSARSDPVARTDWRAFVAMFLVAFLPTLIAVTALFGILGPSGAVDAFGQIYVTAFTLSPLGGAEAATLLAVTAIAILPYLIHPLAYFFFRDRRRQPWSAVMVGFLPLYLVGGTLIFSWPVTASLPAAVLIATFASWLAVARLTPIFKRVALGLMILGTLVSWTLPISI